RTLAPRLRNVAYMSVWAAIFLTMQFVTGAKETMARGDILLAQNRVSEAVVRYQQFTRSQPNDPEGYTKLGSALLQSARADEALPELRKAVELERPNAEAQSALGVSLIQNGQLEQGGTVLQKAIQLDPMNA